ncbi:hypothetical protein ACFV9G_09575 [Nocardioides sp. NPDC059952]|uniref:hypothetical protein n=1 Tax=Nocardioides sp. NPDC059952 TaxID=3347014 RepID=UPI003651842E
MTPLLLVKVFLAPAIVFLASSLAGRLGPRRGGFFIGLPTTSLPFMLVIWMGSGAAAAGHAAAGALSGQLVCALFCIAYARTAPRLGSLASMLVALAVATAAGFATLVLSAPVIVVVLVWSAAVVGLATWPPQPSQSPAAPATRGDVLLRMGMAGATVVAMSAIEPHVGSTLAGALASLPTILMVMSPAVHAAHGPASAVSLTHGTLASISGTAVCLCAVAVLTPALGILSSAGIGLAALLVANAIIGRLGNRTIPMASGFSAPCTGTR